MATLSLKDINIRTNLQPGDLGYIAYLHGIIYAAELQYGLNFEGYVLDGLHEFAHHYNPSKDKVWLCEHEGRIIGSLIAFCREDSVQLRYFILLPEYRSIGLGKALMSAFMNFLKEQGHRKAYLWTTEQQEAATALYIKHGFRLTEEKFSDAFDVPLTERKFEVILG
jgi:GNAT superfamily N-acetyltransferase